jgi:cell division protein FtsA
MFTEQMFIEHPLLGIDIGAHTIKCVIGVRNEQSGVIDMIAAALSPTDGMTDGRITNKVALSRVLQQCIDRVVLSAMCIPREAFICTSGYHCFSMDAQTQLAVREGLVSHAHVVQLVEAAATSVAALPAKTYRLTHVVPQRFTLDQQRHTLSPVGEPASQITLNAHLFYADTEVYEGLWSLQKTLTVGHPDLGGRAPLPLVDVMNAALPLGESLLREGDPQQTLTVIDMGASMTKMLIFERGRPIYVKHMAQGGDSITRELCSDLGAARLEDAEQIKEQLKSLRAPPSGDRIPVWGGPDSEVRYKRPEAVARVVERVVTQQLSAVRVRLQKDEAWSYTQGGVLLTGGTAALGDLRLLASDVLQTRAQIGVPAQEGVSDLVRAPQFAAVNGLVLAGLRRRQDLWFSCWGRALRDVPAVSERVVLKRRDAPSVWQRVRDVLFSSSAP